MYDLLSMCQVYQFSVSECYFCDNIDISHNTFTNYGRYGLGTWKRTVSYKQLLIFCVTYYLNISTVCRSVSFQRVILFNEVPWNRFSRETSK